MLDVEKRKAELFSGSAIDLNQPNPTYPSYPFTSTATTASNTTVQPSATVGAPSPYTPYANTNTNINIVSQPLPSSLLAPLTSSRHIDTDLNLTLQPGNITPTRNNNNIPDTTSTTNINNIIDMKSALLPQYMATKHSAQKSNFTSPNPITAPSDLNLTLQTGNMYTPTTDTEYMNSISQIKQDIYGTNSITGNGAYTNSINTNGSSGRGAGSSGNVYVSGNRGGGVSYIGNTTLDLTKAHEEVDSITALLSYDLYNNSTNTNNTNNYDTNTTISNSKPQCNSISSALNSVLNDSRLSLSATSGPKPEDKKDSGLTPPHNYDLATSSPSSPPLSKVSPISTYETNTNNNITQHLSNIYTNSSVKSIKQYWKQAATSTSTSAPSSSKGQNYDHPSGYNTERSLPSSAELLYTTAIGTNLLDNTQNNSSSKGHNSDRIPSTPSVPIVSKYTNINSKNVNTKILNTLTSTTHNINNYNNNSFLNTSSSSDNKRSLPLYKKPRTATTTTATNNSNAIPTAIPEPNPTPVSASKIPRLSLTSPASTPVHSYNSTNIADITPYKPTTTSGATISHYNNHNLDTYNSNTYTNTNNTISPVQTEAINDLVDRLERVAVTLEGHPDRFLSKLQSLLPLESNRLGWEGEEDIDLNQTLTTSNNYTGKLNVNTTAATSNYNNNTNQTKHIVAVQSVLVDKSSHPFHRVEVIFALISP